jgi:DNA-binding CsgD family transcriptional regulator
MKTLTKTAIKAEKPQEKQQLNFLLTIVDNLEDGILIFTDTGELVYSNASANSVCSKIKQSTLNQNTVPSLIWNLCKSEIQNQMYCDNLTIWTEDIAIDRSVIFRVRVRWLNLELSEQPYLLVTIENRYETLKNFALSAANTYHLTQREAEIWSLYLAKFSYKQIASQLYITVNTVKKHIKNIRAKQQRFCAA